MTKQEAINGMQSGRAYGTHMTHRLFMKGEYIHIKHGIIHDENDMPLKDFWDYRIGSEWDIDWDIEEFPGLHI